MARPTKLTPDVQARIVNAVTMGATYEHAAAYGGVTYEAMRTWMRKGERGREPYAAFLAALKDAEGAAVVASLATIRQASKEHWQAAAWLLERRYPGIYGRRVVEARLSVDDLRRRAEAAGLDPDEVVAEAEAISGLLSDDGR